MRTLAAILVSTVVIFAAGEANAAPVTLEQAQASYAQGKYQQAVIQYQQILQNNPNDVAARLGLAKTQSILGRLRTAEREAQEILDRNPNQVDALILLGNISGRRENWAVARTYYEQALGVDSNNVEAMLGLSAVLLHQGEEEAADAEFARSKALTNQQ